ncbi:MAG: thioredoxin family protein [Alphaproteobacteria bacterium]
MTRTTKVVSTVLSIVALAVLALFALPRTKAATDTAQLAMAKELRSFLDQSQGVIELTAAWCPYCKQMNHRLPAIRAQRPDVPFLHIDIDKHPALHRVFHGLGVTGVPSYLFIKDKKVVDLLAGPSSIDEFVEYLAGQFPPDGNSGGSCPLGDNAPALQPLDI